MQVFSHVYILIPSPHSPVALHIYVCVCVCVCVRVCVNIVYIVINSYNGHIMGFPVWAFLLGCLQVHICKNIEKNVNIYMTLIML